MLRWERNEWVNNCYVGLRWVLRGGGERLWRNLRSRAMGHPHPLLRRSTETRVFRTGKCPTKVWVVVCTLFGLLRCPRTRYIMQGVRVWDRKPKMSVDSPAEIIRDGARINPTSSETTRCSNSGCIRGFIKPTSVHDHLDEEHHQRRQRCEQQCQGDESEWINEDCGDRDNRLWFAEQS